MTRFAGRGNPRDVENLYGRESLCVGTNPRGRGLPVKQVIRAMKISSAGYIRVAEALSAAGRIRAAEIIRAVGIIHAAGIIHAVGIRETEIRTRRPTGP